MLSFHLSINVIIIVVSFKILDLCPIALFQQLWNTLYSAQLKQFHARLKSCLHRILWHSKEHVTNFLGSFCVAAAYNVLHNCWMLFCEMNYGYWRQHRTSSWITRWERRPPIWLHSVVRFITGKTATDESTETETTLKLCQKCLYSNKI